MIPRGTILYNSKPFLYCLSENGRKSHCNFCLQRQSIKLCSGCYYVGYCDEECQMKAWSDHKQECKDIKTNTLTNEIISNDVRLLAHVIRKMKKKSNREAVLNLELCEKYKTINEERQVAVKEIYDELCSFMGPKNVPDEDELYKIIGRIYYHTFPLYNLDTTPIGFAIHLVPQLKHSCTPNTVFAYTGSTLFITALQDLPELDWNNITAAFMYPVFGVDDRIWNVRLKFISECGCKKCTEGNMKLALCSNKNCRGPCHVEDDTNCPNCGIELSAEFISSYNKVLQLTLGTLYSERDSCNQKLLQVCYKKLVDITDPTNSVLIQLTERLYILEEWNGHWLRAIDYLEKAIKGFEYYYTQDDIGMALMFHKLAMLRMLLENMDGYGEELEKVKRIFKFTFGETLGNHLVIEMVKKTTKIVPGCAIKNLRKINL